MSAKKDIKAFIEMLSLALSKADFIEEDGTILYVDPNKLSVNSDQDIITLTLSDGNTYNIKTA